MSERKFTVIGLSDNREQWFNPTVVSIIKRGKVFSGGKRHHDIVADLLPSDAVWIDITAPLEKVFKEYAPFADIVVFASGDPLFFGYAVTLQREFPYAKMEIFPTFNSIQMLAHKLMLPYSDMIYVSVTGRPWKNLEVALIRGQQTIGVLTDRKKGPAEIAERMLYYGYDNYIMSVGECLGHSFESVRTLSLKEAASTVFRNPNCVILQKTKSRNRFFGIPENLFSHLDGRSKMITKMPVRLLSLAMMDLFDKSVMWDIGFCTGSVSIEAKIRFPELDIVAFERREESRVLIDENCRRFGTPGIEAVIADFMECDLSKYATPDAVFIGGHGGRLDEMLRKVFPCLRPGGCVVFNSVSEDSRATFITAVENCGRSIAESHRLYLDSNNPITIMKAI
ncbi:MAG: precorrin-6y C5,15-methyltransferase (decarboxylating) subunit CbiE [Bacteroides sp.]|nr:precorrin-6y C5,15-methyltransferase (decarboxylating) subunit CbiE [Bacteroides sp.]